MELEDFAEILQKNVKKELGDGYEIAVRKINRNNGVAYTGLSMKRYGEETAPLVYLDEYFEKYKRGNATLAEVTDYVVRNSRRKPRVDVKKFLEYETVRGKIVYRLINTERNRELLEDIPHIEFMDLSIVFRCLVGRDGDSVSSILIHNIHLKLWDITVENLFRAAKENTQRLEPYEIKTMADVLREIMLSEEPPQFHYDECIADCTDSVPMYVLSNRGRIEGAACMLYPNLVRDFSDRTGSSFYIIPSSLHEVLLIPTENDGDSEEIRNMIREINDTMVSPEDILSYSLYYYDREEGKITML